MDNMHLKHKDYLMTKTEHDLYQLLISLLPRKYYLFPQIHIGSITKPSARKNNDGSWKWWKFVRSTSDKYSVDFVVCDKDKIMPLLVIELDDISHLQKDRQERDKTVERWLEEAELDILRIKLSDSTNEYFVRSQLAKHLLV